MGRIEINYANGNIRTFKDGSVTGETTGPWEGASMFIFPETIQDLSWPGRGNEYHVMDGYDAVWTSAPWADLFCEPLHTDGALTEQISIVLLRRFRDDPIPFMRALHVCHISETALDLVADLLAYSADYGDLGDLEKQVQAVRTALADEPSVTTVDRVLEMIELYRNRTPGRIRARSQQFSQPAMT